MQITYRKSLIILELFNISSRMITQNRHGGILIHNNCKPYVYFNRLKVYIFSIANHCELKWQTLAKFRQVDVFAKDDGAMAWIEKPEPEDTAKLEQLRKAQV